MFIGAARFLCATLCQMSDVRFDSIEPREGLDKMLGIGKIVSICPEKSKGPFYLTKYINVGSRHSAISSNKLSCVVLLWGGNLIFVYASVKKSQNTHTQKLTKIHMEFYWELNQIIRTNLVLLKYV